MVTILTLRNPALAGWHRWDTILGSFPRLREVHVLIVAELSIQLKMRMATVVTDQDRQKAFSDSTNEKWPERRRRLDKLTRYCGTEMVDSFIRLSNRRLRREPCTVSISYDRRCSFTKSNSFCQSWTDRKRSLLKPDQFCQSWDSILQERLLSATHSLNSSFPAIQAKHVFSGGNFQSFSFAVLDFKGKPVWSKSF